ncbi:META domain-containing protein [Actinokineospora globicatena]|uniref:META domain-containing protein n=1 Tax=Actinokineospora globicatena TaxID=103729 RepID=UPI0020A3A3B2|nr:META domain-containing protein [Actinokineospora globicatena]MCP2302559.1 META domain-containing protein [Actinokineospora globicatena]GLW75754.1 hypothetical protein Aglo01_02360 [Actinokineospora globicatena]GLW82594.1 hypothetical protein Aglo02_02350 [Actinokineospora globicatena]
MSEAERRLRDAFTEGAAHAPSDDGMLAAVHHRVRRRRTTRLAVAAGVAVLGLAGGAVYVAENGPPDMTATAVGAAQRPGAAIGVVGSWEPVSVTGFSGSLLTPRSQAPWITLTGDGRWSASDGCNTTSGRYKAGGDQFAATTEGPSTLIGCANVPNAHVLTHAATYAVRGEELIFYGTDGAELGTYRRVAN